MKIAICDDDFEILNQIKEHTNLFFQDKNREVAFLTYHNGTSVIHAVLEEHAEIDILLLDIDMPGVSGFEAAKILRETNDDIILIFISSHEQYVYDSFEYNPFRYIRKSRMKQELPLALRAAEALYQKRVKRYVAVKCEEAEYRIEQSEITYFEIVKRRLCVHLEDGRVLHTWKSLKEFQRDVSAESFVKIHSGCVVNMEYVSGYAGCEIVLDNGERLPASRGGMKVFKDELLRYWSKRV